MQIVLLLDGTKDIDQAKRCKEAAKVGPRCRIGVLPAGEDPDEQIETTLRGAIADARPVLDEFLTLIEMLAQDDEARPKALAELGRALSEWRTVDPGGAGERCARVCDALSMSKPDYEAWLGKEGVRRRKGNGGGEWGTQSPWRPDPDHPQQPAAPELRSGDERPPVVTNYKVEKKEVEEDGKTKTVTSTYRLRIEEIRDQVQGAMNGYPYRWGPAGEKHPILFVPDGRGKIRPFHTGKSLETVVHEYADVKFKGGGRSGNDQWGRNFLAWEHLFQHFAGSTLVPEFAGIAYKPHEPRMKELFYTWRAPDYQPDGSYLAWALDLFPNISKPWQKAVFAASLCTPFWGGPPGRRPAFVFGADGPGKGKGRASELVGAAAGGMLEMEPGQQGEQDLKKRILSGDSFWKVVIRLDNLKTALNSTLLDSLITAPTVSGHKMYAGEGSRPNNLTLLVTANDIKVSPDMARRAFFIWLDTPQLSSDWETQYQDLERHGDHLVADALHVLRQPAGPVDFGDQHETFLPWARDVLARVLAYPPLQRYFEGLTLKEVLAANQALRQDTDYLFEEAQQFGEALIAFICVTQKWLQPPAYILEGQPVKYAIERPKDDVSVTADELLWCWRWVFGRSKTSTKNWIGRNVKGHIKGGRLKVLSVPATRVSQGSRYLLAKDAVIAYLDAVGKGEADVPKIDLGKLVDDKG